jgi:hypothetical protein
MYTEKIDTHTLEHSSALFKRTDLHSNEVLLQVSVSPITFVCSVVPGWAGLGRAGLGRAGLG